MRASATETIEISRITPGFLRWGLGLFGAAIAVIALSELWRAVWPISIVTPFFGLMFGIALFAGGSLVIGSILGPDEAWSIAPGHLVIRQSLRGVRRQLDYDHRDIDTITVETSDWDSRPATYYLAIRLATGKQLKSPEFGTEAKAQAALSMLTARG